MLLKLLVGFFGVFCSMPLLAASIFSPNRPQIQMPPSLVVPANATNGTVLWRSNKIDIDLAVSSYGQVSSPIFGTVDYLATGPNLGGDIHPTTLFGVGLRWMTIFRTASNLGGVTSSLTLQLSPKYPIGVAGAVTLRQTVWAELVKTGNVSSGSVQAETRARLIYNYSSDDMIVQLIGPSKVTVGPSCKVSSPSIPVSLGKISVDSFIASGASSSPVAFNILLSCSGGQPGAAIGGYVVLTDMSRPENLSDTLSLSPTSKAKGIGIQILSGDTPVKFGPESADPQAINQWKAGDIRTGTTSFQIPLSARYIKTAPNVIPGTANGQATFTMSYR